MLQTPYGYIAPEWQDLARKLVEGDGINWTGDPRLDLRIGVLTNRKTGKEGRRLEVWRSNEDGSESLVGHWLPREQAHVCYDLARMRPERPGHVSILDVIDKHNAELEAKASADFIDAMLPAAEHAARLFHDQNNPRNTFYMNGPGDRGGRA
jgi:hypothetical protein